MTLTAKQLTVSIGKRDILTDLSFQAQRSELLVIVGPNGSGKTTLLKAIAGLTTWRGQLDWDNLSLAEMSAAKRARIMAYLPQGHIAHWPILARDVVAIGRAPLASSLSHLSAADEQAIDRAIEAVAATAFADRPVTDLSGGERARIMLARALAVDAPVLLADEPVASLDPEHQLSVMNILTEQARQGRLVIAVSHDLVHAARFADRVMVLGNEKIVGPGRPKEILTGALLREVFNVEPLNLTAPGVSVQIPWTPLPRSTG